MIFLTPVFNTLEAILL